VVPAAAGQADEAMAFLSEAVRPAPPASKIRASLSVYLTPLRPRLYSQKLTACRMKTLPLATVLGILIALPIIYALQPLNAAAVGLLLVLCIGIAQLPLALLKSHKARRRSPRPTDPPDTHSKKTTFILGLSGAVVVAGSSFLLLRCPAAPPGLPPTPTRSYLAQGEVPPAGYGAYGYVVLTQRAPLQNPGRYDSFCRAYIAHLELSSRYPTYPREDLLPTFWPLDLSKGQFRSVRDCDVALLHYDYARAKSMAANLKVLNRPGPVLAAWLRPFEQTSGATDEHLALDLSDFADEDLDRALGIWTQDIATDPSAWHGGFKTERFKESFRNLLQKYGAAVLAIVHPEPPRQEPPAAH
jgi:hypothetical protein